MGKMTRKELASYLSSVLGNIAVIGFGLALFERSLYNLVPATISLVLGAYILKELR